MSDIQGDPNSLIALVVSTLTAVGAAAGAVYKKMSNKSEDSDITEKIKPLEDRVAALEVDRDRIDDIKKDLISIQKEVAVMTALSNEFKLSVDKLATNLNSSLEKIQSQQLEFMEKLYKRDKE